MSANSSTAVPLGGNQQARHYFEKQRERNVHTEIQTIHSGCLQAPVEVHGKTRAWKPLSDSRQVRAPFFTMKKTIPAKYTFKLSNYKTENFIFYSLRNRLLKSIR